MGIQREGGYSATVQAYLLVGAERFEVAKTGIGEFVIAEPCELPPGCDAELVVIIDGQQYSRAIVLDLGIARGQQEVPFSNAVPF